MVVRGSAQSFTIRVKPPTQITTQPVLQTVCIGSPVTLNVTASGADTLSYQWLKGNTTVMGATAAAFSIPTTTTADEGSYKVYVTGGCGTVTSNDAFLTVNTSNGCITSISNAYEIITSFKLLPNNITNQTTLRRSAVRSLQINWEIIDASGRVIKNFEQKIIAGQPNDKILEPGYLTNGSYLLRALLKMGKPLCYAL